MFCNKCGNELGDDAKFCSKCGNKVEKDKACNTLGYEPVIDDNANNNTFDIEQLKNIHLRLIDILKKQKYFVLGAACIIIFMLIIIPVFNKKYGKLFDNTQVGEANSIYSNLENSYISDENINNEDSDFNKSSSINSEYNQKVNEEPANTEMVYDTITDVYMGQGKEYIDYATKQHFPPQFIDRLEEISNSEADGSIGMRFEIITLPKPKGKEGGLYDPFVGVEMTEEDMSNFIETIKSHLGNWGINIYETFNDNHLVTNYHLGCMYYFSDTDVNVYLDIKRGIYQVIVWN